MKNLLIKKSTGKQNEIKKRRKRRSRDFRWQLIIIFLLGIISSLGLIKLQIENDLATSANDYMRLISEAKQLKNENDRLQERVLLDSSLTVIFQKAQHLGFIPAVRYIYLH